jgi:hypothetical protein
MVLVLTTCGEGSAVLLSDSICENDWKRFPRFSAFLYPVCEWLGYISGKRQTVGRRGVAGGESALFVNTSRVATHKQGKQWARGECLLYGFAGLAPKSSAKKLLMAVAERTSLGAW